MLLRPKEELAYIDGEFQKVDVISILGLIMSGKCRGNIYITIHGKLYGRISLLKPKYTDDKKYFMVEFDIPKVQMWEYKKARDLFVERNLQSVPVVDGDGILIGEFVNGNTERRILQSRNVLKWLGETAYAGKRTLLIWPNNCSLEVGTVFARDIEKYMHVTLSTWQETLGELTTQYELVLYFDEGLKSCANVFFSQLGVQISNMSMTCVEFLNSVSAVHRRKAFADSMSGVNLFTFDFDYDDPKISNTAYMKRYKRVMRHRRAVCRSKATLPGKETTIPPEFKEEFLDDLYSPEYWNEFKSRRYYQHKINGVTWLNDVRSKYVNIVDGKRVNLFYQGGQQSFGCGCLAGACLSVPESKIRIPLVAYCNRSATMRDMLIAWL